jgi:hypothetical protein
MIAVAARPPRNPRDCYVDEALLRQPKRRPFLCHALSRLAAPGGNCIARAMRELDGTELLAVAALLLSSDLRLRNCHEASHDFDALYPAWRCCDRTRLSEYRCRVAG